MKIKRLTRLVFHFSERKGSIWSNSGKWEANIQAEWDDCEHSRRFKMDIRAEHNKGFVCGSEEKRCISAFKFSIWWCHHCSWKTCRLWWGSWGTHTHPSIFKTMAFILINLHKSNQTHFVINFIKKIKKLIFEYYYVRLFGRTVDITIQQKRTSENLLASLKRIMWISPMSRY